MKNLSPSNTYVAICNKTNFDGYYLKEFVVPQAYRGTDTGPSWYFLNILDGVACLEMVITKEEYANLS